MPTQFEWDPAKAATNHRKHGVSFAWAKGVFNDVFAMERLDDRHAYGEDRFVTIGAIAGDVFVVVSTERDGRIRLISARRAG